PHAGVAGVRPRILLPRVVAVLAGERNRVEDPETLSGARVVTADETFLVNAALRLSAGQMRRADDDDVLGDRRSGVQSHLADGQVDRLIVVLFQIDDALLAESGRGNAGLRVERDHAIARRDVDDAGAGGAGAGPVGEAAARQLARRRLAALAFVLAVHPDQLPGAGVERDHGAART